MRLMTGAIALAAMLAGCGQQTAPPVEAAAGDAAPVEMAAAPPAQPAPVASGVASAGPIDGVWRCKMVGDIPLGTLTFTGGSYVLQNTTSAWEPSPNKSDGSGTVTFDTTFAIPVDGPLKNDFEVTGAFGDGSFINWNNNSGMLFGCRRP